MNLHTVHLRDMPPPFWSLLMHSSVPPKCHIARRFYTQPATAGAPTHRSSCHNYMPTIIFRIGSGLEIHERAQTGIRDPRAGADSGLEIHEQTQTRG